MEKLKKIFILAATLFFIGCKTPSYPLSPTVSSSLRPSRPELKAVPETATIPLEVVENFISVSSYAKELEIYCDFLEDFVL